MYMYLCFEIITVWQKLGFKQNTKAKKGETGSFIN